MGNFKVIGRDGKEIQTDVSLHPGEIIESELEARNIRKTEMAKQMEMNLANLSELIHQKRNVSPAIALKLEKTLGIKAEYWLRIQADYDLFNERKKYIGIDRLVSSIMKHI
jgi:addiction module HigA family antidote